MRTICLALILLAAALFPATARAQDSLGTAARRPWYFPDHVTVQFAGNIGLLSAGPGYSFARDRMHAEVLYGFVPGFEAQSAIHMLTAKWSYQVFRLSLKPGYVFVPLKLGTGISYSIGPQFYTKWPQRYPDGYYWWSTSFRLTPFVGTSLSRQVGHDKSLVKKVQLYGEFGTHDLALVSFFSNKKLPFTDIWNIALGTRLVF